MCFYHQDQIYSESLMRCVCACYQDQNYSYFRLFRMKWSILILVALMPCLQALCFMNVSFGQMICLGVGHVIEFVFIFAQLQKNTPDSLFTDMLLAYLTSYITVLLINFPWYMHLWNTHYPYINMFVQRNVHATGLERGWGLEDRMPVRWSLTRTAARFLFFDH